MALYFFYFFAFLAILSSFFVIFANNPVHSVLWLIVTFFSVAGFFYSCRGRIFSSTSDDRVCGSASGLISVRSYDAQY